MTPEQARRVTAGHALILARSDAARLAREIPEATAHWVEVVGRITTAMHELGVEPVLEDVPAEHRTPAGRYCETQLALARELTDGGVRRIVEDAQRACEHAIERGRMQRAIAGRAA